MKCADTHFTINIHWTLSRILLEWCHDDKMLRSRDKKIEEIKQKRQCICNKLRWHTSHSFIPKQALKNKLKILIERSIVHYTFNSILNVQKHQLFFLTNFFILNKWQDENCIHVASILWHSGSCYTDVSLCIQINNNICQEKIYHELLFENKSKIHIQLMYLLISWSYYILTLIN